MPFMITLDDPNTGEPFCDPFPVPGVYEVVECFIRYGNLGLNQRISLLKTLQRDKIVEIIFEPNDSHLLNITVMELTRIDIIEMNTADYAKYGMNFGRI